MAEPIRIITFSTAESDADVSNPRFAGVQGEHNATEVQFSLEDSWINEDFQYRIEFTDGNGCFDTTDFLVPSDNVVSVLLPSSWTSAGGNASIRLNATILDEQSEAEQIIYSFGARLFFDSRDEGEPISVEEEGGLSSLISQANQSIDAANSAAANATASAVVAEGAAGRANAAAQAAEEVAQEVQGKLDRGELTGPKGDKGDTGPQGEKGEKGEAGKAPYIGEDGQWYAWDEDSGAYEDTGVSSTTLVDENSGQRVRMWFGTIAEYNALPEIRADTYYNILEGVVP